MQSLRLICPDLRSQMLGGFGEDFQLGDLDLVLPLDGTTCCRIIFSSMYRN